MDTRALPPYLRLNQIIGQAEVTPEQAAANKAKTQTAKTHHYTRPRPAISGLIPISKTSFYAGIKKGIFPKPCHLQGTSTSMWRTDELLAALEKAAV